MMSASSAYLRQFTVSGDKTPVFFGLYTTGEREYKLMQYAYDKTVPSVQEETLSVYSMKEDRTVAQAVYAFQSSHPEVKVDYRFAAGAAVGRRYQEPEYGAFGRQRCGCGYT